MADQLGVATDCSSGEIDGAATRRAQSSPTRAAIPACPTVPTLRDHDFRDTAVTWLALAGCDIWEICSITGHSFKTAADVLKHYLAIHPDMATSAMKKMQIWYDQKKLQ